MSSRISKEDFCEMLSSERRKAQFISELELLLSVREINNDKNKLIENFIGICKNAPDEIFLLKIYSELLDNNNINSYNKFGGGDYVLLFKKVHSFILSHPNLKNEELVVCTNIERYLLMLYSEKLI